MRFVSNITAAIRVRFSKISASRAGFTLTEMLATVIVLGLATVGMASAITLATNQYTTSMAHSQAQQLYSTLQQSMDTALRYTKRYYGDTSHLDGYLDDLRANDNQKYVYLKTIDDDGDINDYGTPGELALCTGDKEPSIKLIIGKGSYNYGLKASVTQFKYNETDHYFTVTLNITRDGEADPLVSETFTVEALNKPALDTDTAQN